MAKSVCPRCGSQVAAADEFCTTCGAKVKKGAVANRPASHASKRKTNRNGLFLLAGVALIGVAIVLGLNLLNTSSSRAVPPTSEIEDVHDEAGMPYPEVPRIELTDAKTRYDAKSAVFVDVRGQSDYAAAHVPDAVSLPLSEIEARFAELPRDREILTYCT